MLVNNNKKMERINGPPLEETLRGQRDNCQLGKQGEVQGKESKSLSQGFPKIGGSGDEEKGILEYCILPLANQFNRVFSQVNHQDFGKRKVCASSFRLRKLRLSK